GGHLPGSFNEVSRIHVVRPIRNSSFERRTCVSSSCSNIDRHRHRRPSRNSDDTKAGAWKTRSRVCEHHSNHTESSSLWFPHSDSLYWWNRHKNSRHRASAVLSAAHCAKYVYGHTRRRSGGS